jgi:hypothetical protein
VEWAPSLIPSNPPTTIHSEEPNDGLTAPTRLARDSPDLAVREPKRCIPMAFPPLHSCLAESGISERNSGLAWSLLAPLGGQYRRLASPSTVRWRVNDGPHFR